jgi:hypothetical protein
MYDFAQSVAYDVFTYNSRIETSVAYSTVIRMLKSLSLQEAVMVKLWTRSYQMECSYVQNYLFQRDQIISRTNKMNVGLAATYIEIKDIDPKAYDLDGKLRRVDNSILSLQWLLTLARYIPELATIKSHITMLYRTRTAK